MNRPTMAEFDGWKNTAVGAWYFEYVQDQADKIAMANGRQVGQFENEGVDHMIAVRQAGFVKGMEDVITHDPFEDEREEKENDETHLDR